MKIILKKGLLFLITLFSLFLLQDAQASHIPCGASLVQDTTLDEDLKCQATFFERIAIIIGEDNIVLDCAGHTITGTISPEMSSFGIVLYSHTNVSIKNCNVQNFTYGIDIAGSDLNKITQNNFTNNIYGINIHGPNTTLKNNIMNNNKFNFNAPNPSINNTIDASNTVNGKPIYYVKNIKNEIFDSSTNAGTFFCINCNNVTIKNLTLTNNGAGITLENSINITVQGVNVSNNSDGIVLSASNSNKLIGNIAYDNDKSGINIVGSNYNNLTQNMAFNNNRNGISVADSDFNYLTQNMVFNNNEIGIELFGSDSNILVKNRANNNRLGISIPFSHSNTLLTNTMGNNEFNFLLYGYFDHSIDKSNTVNGNPIFYLKNIKNEIFDSSTNAGTFFCINCNNVTIKNLTLTNNGAGITLFMTENSTIQKINAEHNFYGIYLVHSNYNKLTENIADNNSGDGIFLLGADFNILAKNRANSNEESGLHLDGGDSNVIVQNTLANNERSGIFLVESQSNKIFQNMANNNTKEGISLIHISHYNTVSQNTADNNEDGISLATVHYNNVTQNTANNNLNGINLQQGSANNIITHNTLFNNDKSGIIMTYADFNKLSNNIFVNNGVGIYSYFDNAENLIYNNFFNNTINAIDETSIDFGNNSWNTAKDCTKKNIIGGDCIGGNFWSDYKGKDTDGDGLGDSLLPYNANGNIKNGGDFHPLVQLAPIIQFLRGDSNTDGIVDISDSINTLGFLFTGVGKVNCKDAADANDDGEVDISDAIRTLNFLFLGGVIIPQPHPNPGVDSTNDNLGCESYNPPSGRGSGGGGSIQTVKEALNETKNNNTLDNQTKSFIVDYLESIPKGNLSITSTPTGAAIYLDGSYKGLTPKTITNLVAGNYNLKLVKSGYYDYTTIANIQPGNVTKLSITLQPRASPTPSPTPYY